MIQDRTRPHTPVCGSRPVFFERFDDGTAYCINLEHPTGVHYLKQPAADRLAQILDSCSNPIDLSTAESALDASSEMDMELIAKIIDPTRRIERFQDCLPKRQRRDNKGELNIWFHISNSCNLSCNYCYIPQLKKAVNHASADSLADEQTISAVVSELFALCKSEGFRSLRLRFAGGEPSLATALIERTCKEALHYSAEYKIPVVFSVLTNGTLVTPEFLRILKSYPFRGVSISIDGDQALHDKTRFRVSKSDGKFVREGTWDLIFRNVEVLGRLGIRPYILTTLTETNYSHINELVEACLQHKLGFRLSPVRDEDTAFKPGLQDAILATLTTLYEELPERLPMSRPIQRFANFAEWAPQVKKSVACGTCRSSFAVGQRGGVSTCQMRLETSQGRIGDEPLNDIFRRMQQSQSNWRFMSPESSTGGCSSCQWRYTCAGGCPEHTLMACSTYDSPSPWCQLYGDFLPVYFRAIARQMKLYCSEQRIK